MGMTLPLELHDRVAGKLQTNWRENDWFYCDSAVIRHYAFKAAVVAAAAPRTGIEIGTRCGYSLLSFNEAMPTTSWLCIDGAMDEDSYDCLAHAKRLIERHTIFARLIVVDSHAIRSLPPADFAHVDGDHSFDGALADLRLVSGCKVILADDCDNRDVRRAVDEFVRESGRAVEFYDDGLRKAAVLT
jgi:cephalosporin hydroxylase